MIFTSEFPVLVFFRYSIQTVENRNGFKGKVQIPFIFTLSFDPNLRMYQGMKSLKLNLQKKTDANIGRFRRGLISNIIRGYSDSIGL